jgi:fumarate reductase iron-sulfur subunit
MANRTLTFSIFRYNPYNGDAKPRLDEYKLDETPRMTLFTVLSRIREEQDSSLQFDFVCRSAICGSCGMLVNGKPRLACRTRTAELPEKITLLPLPFFRLVGDLSVDTGTWFREMGQRVRSWVHTDLAFDPDGQEERMSNQDAQAVYELDRCIECGCCIAACQTGQLRPDFLGAAGLARLGRFLLDPRDRRSDGEVFEVVGTDEGIFGCVGLLACQDHCPKELPLATQLAYLRRKLTRASLRRQSSITA